VPERTAVIETAPSLHVPFGTVALFLLAIVHCGWRYGLRTTLIFLLISLAISNTFENLGVLTGFPFGPYYYTEALGPKLFQVPLLVSLAWFSMGYLSWTLAGVLLGVAKNNIRVRGLVWEPLVTALLMVAWDLTFDPLSSTVYRSWVWLEGGPYFGVPVSNFLGWLLTAFLVMLAFSLYLRFVVRNNRKDYLALPNWYWLAAIVVYGLMGLFPLTSWLALPPVVISDPAGRTWQAHDICAVLSLVSLGTVVSASIYGCVRILRTKASLS
jgi:putative membrane protein